MNRSASLVLFFAALVVAAPVSAQTAATGTLPTELEALGRWVAARQPQTACTARCYVLDRLALTGALSHDGPTRVGFELTGGVLAPGAVAVPLFGSPEHVSLEHATENGHAASVGFESGHYYLFTDARHFTLRGTLQLDDDLALTIAGPLDTLVADLTGGSLVEGVRLSGLADATVHFETGNAVDVPNDSPAVFQIARAVRVGREITFEYHVTMRSGHELGVVRFPLPFGERVIDVQGAATGWRVDGSDLVLPTAGREADVVVTGTLPSLAAPFATDSRSAYEWWLFESDPEHRITVATEGRQHDASESPIARTQPNARLYLVDRGQRAQVAVQTLVSADVLAAVVREHTRNVVWTARGDLVADDTLSYDNNGIDYLLYAPAARPIYLGTDGTSERIMHRDRDLSTVMIPLRSGAHTARIQSLSGAALGTFAGHLALDAPSYPLATSHAVVTLGLPAGVHPLLATGGDTMQGFVDGGDAMALMVALAIAWVALRGRTRRALGFVALGGLWFASHAAFVAAVALVVGAGIVWLASRFVRGPALVATACVVLGATGFASLAGIAVFTTRDASEGPGIRAMESQRVSNALDQRTRAIASADAQVGNEYGSFNAQNALATGGVIQGVTPVAIALPHATRAVSFTRELVTRARPFHPTLWYVTDAGLAPFALAWLGCIAALLVAHRRALLALRDALAARLATRAGDAPAVG